MSATVPPLKDRILAELTRKPGQKAAELAKVLECERRDVNRCLSFDLAGRVRQGSDYRWHLASNSRDLGTTPALATELGRLSRYYLECIGQDMDEGASVFARNQFGDLDYAGLPSVPIGSGYDWWNSPGVDRLIGKVFADRGKLMLWLGYPVRLRQHRTARWEGFFVEPVLMWPVVLPEQRGDVPKIDEQMPTVNAKFLRAMALGDGMQLAEELVRLSEELGLGVPAGDLPDLEDLIERMVRVRPDWDWREPLDPATCPGTPTLSDISTAGIYNRAIIVPAQRSPYTQGLESELTALGNLPAGDVASTALGHWLSPDSAHAAGAPQDAEPLIEVVPMNTEQRVAVQSALMAPLTVVTGPPGTGKSQMVTNLIVNAAWRGMKVLFASKNNKAVDVVEARVNGLGNRPVLLRLGSQEYQERLAGYLTQLLAGTPAAEVKANYEEGLSRHRSLEKRLADLSEVQQQTLDCRNLVDRLDSEIDEFRPVFAEGFSGLTSATRDRAAADIRALALALDGVDGTKQNFVVRILWDQFRPRRFAMLEKVAADAEMTLQLLGVAWPNGTAEDGIAVFRQRLDQLQAKLAAVSRVVEYCDALKTLQALPTFEDIARQRAALTDEVGQNSERLWRDWVELAPTRLTPAQRRDIADYATALQAMTGPDSERVHGSVRRRARELQAKVIPLFSCLAVTSLSARGRIPMQGGYFDLAVIDEASQCDIASALPLLYRAKRSVIIGDPMQLRHISTLTRPRDSELQHKYGLTESRLGWMYSVSSLFDVAAGVVSPENIINLRDHHRSHADIIEFCNKTFYEGHLRVATRYAKLKRPKVRQPGIIWQDVKGAVSTPHGGGAQNATEATAIVEAVADLLVARGYTGTVGVVTPFRAQAQLLQQKLQGNPALERVAGRAELLADTVHRFQGDERDVIFFSCVIANGISPVALSFLRSNGNLFNVAITRARGLLHVVGDRTAAARCGVDYLEKFVTYVDGLDAGRDSAPLTVPEVVTQDYPTVAHPERVSEWERVLYRAMVRAGLKPVPQFSVEQYDLDLALFSGGRRLAIEVDGERYHRSWTGELCLRDQLRNQRLIELGWEVRRFWVYEIRDDLARCVRLLADWTASAELEPRSADPQ